MWNVSNLTPVWFISFSFKVKSSIHFHLLRLCHENFQVNSNSHSIEIEIFWLLDTKYFQSIRFDWIDTFHSGMRFIEIKIQISSCFNSVESASMFKWVDWIRVQPIPNTFNRFDSIESILFILACDLFKSKFKFQVVSMRSNLLRCSNESIEFGFNRFPLAQSWHLQFSFMSISQKYLDDN